MSKEDPRPTIELIALALATQDNDACRDLVMILEYRATWEVLEAAHSLTESDDPDSRYLGVRILSELGIPERAFPEEVASILLSLLERETDEDVLAGIGYAFGHNPEAGVVEPLVRRLKDHPSADVRSGLVYGLLTQLDDLAIRTLIELSDDADTDVRDWATFGIGWMLELDRPDIREALVRRLSDEQEGPRGEALRGLALHGDERVIEPLIHELHLIAEADPWCDYALDAAILMPDPRLYPALTVVRDSGIEDSTLERAIALCRIPAPEECKDDPLDEPTCCPVCGLRQAFVDLDDLQFCGRCGWGYDTDQRLNPDSTEGYNPRSLNQESERWRTRCMLAKTDPAATRHKP